MTLPYFTGTSAECDSIGARVDVDQGLPCCTCYLSPIIDCPCERHKLPNGSPAPHEHSCTIRYADKRQHPTDLLLFAYPVNEVVRALLTPEEESRVALLGPEWEPPPPG